ncbi:hypothetical protein GCM10027074_53660 [Streptomyces deserti]
MNPLFTRTARPATRTPDRPGGGQRDRVRDRGDISFLFGRDRGRWSDALPDAFHHARWSDSGVSDLVNEPRDSFAMLLLVQRAGMVLLTGLTSGALTPPLRR